MLQSTEHSLKILEDLQEKNQDFCLIEKNLEQEIENLILAIKEVHVYNKYVNTV